MRLTSPVFADGDEIPKKYTQDGGDVSPPLTWADVPPGARSLALVVDDPDAPDPAAPKRTWVHWIVTNLPPQSAGIVEGARPVGARMGLNDWHRPMWNGPLPPKGRHRYVFKLYALDRTLDLDQPHKDAVEKAMEGHVLAESKLIGTYQRAA